MPDDAANPIPANPFREKLSSRQTPDSCTIVIFGATGDLTHRKLVPALYNLLEDGDLPADTRIIGFARRDKSDEEFRSELEAANREHSRQGHDDALWNSFASLISYHRCEFQDTAGYRDLAAKLEQFETADGTRGNRLFYLASAPEFFDDILTNLKGAGLNEPRANAWSRVVVEKPFGTDLATAQRLNRVVSETFRERDTYRIDHYLGKETVQNIMVFRFANMIFEPNWNRRYVDSVQITVAESLGVENRGGYLDHYGVLRDMVQNHMLSVLSLIAMEPPGSISGDAVRNEKVKVLDAIRPMEPEEVIENCVRGQYGAGVIDGNQVPAYRDEPSVDPHSNTETYAALRLFVENWRWADVPFYLRTGKRLAKHLTQVVIRFKRTPLMLFGEKVSSEAGPNALILNIQPEESISILIRAKKPGPSIVVDSIPLDFDYSQFGHQSPATGYETLLHDCMIGDMTLFHREDSVDASWRIVNPILDVWGALPPRDFPDYEAGSWGPASADKLLERDGRRWENPA
jgi:glucose-6-phosphate 1-dehydrogenase